MSGSEIDALARAQADIAAEQKRSERIRMSELRDAEWFGVDGKGGTLAAMQAKVNEHDHEIEDLKMFKARALWTVSIVGTIGGVIAAAVMWVIGRFLS